MTGSVGQGSWAVVLVNGARLPADGSHVSVRDRGFTLADGLFETMRGRNGVVFQLNQHLQRLSGGLRVMGIAEPPLLRRWVDEAVASVEAAEVSVRLTVTRGSGPGGLAPPAETRPTTVVTVSPMPQFDDKIYRDGLAAIIASGRRNSRSMAAGLKTLSYTDAVLGWLEAQRAGADEAIFLDEDAHCAEATASNLFVYRDGMLLTPPVTCAALPGITRATVIDIARRGGIRVEERAFGAPELLAADEAFLTSSLRGLAPVTGVDGRRIGTGAPGRITQQLTASYAACVERECGAR